DAGTAVDQDVVGGILEGQGIARLDRQRRPRATGRRHSGADVFTDEQAVLKDVDAGDEGDIQVHRQRLVHADKAGAVRAVGAVKGTPHDLTAIRVGVTGTGVGAAAVATLVHAVVHRVIHSGRIQL